MNDGTKDHDRRPPDVLHHRAEEQAADSVDHPKADHDVTHRRDAQSARDESLCEVGADERLLHADPYGYGDEQLLVRFFQLVCSGGKELDSG